jgi:hypothetical protein
VYRLNSEFVPYRFTHDDPSENRENNYRWSRMLWCVHSIPFTAGEVTQTSLLLTGRARCPPQMQPATILIEVSHFDIANLINSIPLGLALIIDH